MTGETAGWLCGFAVTGATVPLLVGPEQACNTSSLVAHGQHTVPALWGPASVSLGRISGVGGWPFLLTPLFDGVSALSFSFCL